MKLTDMRLRQLIQEEVESFNETKVIVQEEDQLDLSKLAPMADKASENIMKMLDDLSLKAANGDEAVATAVKKVIIAKLSAEG